MINPPIAHSNTPYTGYFNVRVDQVKAPDHSLVTYSCVELKGDAAVVLARTTTGKLVLNREYRHPTRQWLLGLPGGRIDAGESPLEAGRRELMEESGYTGGQATLLASVFPMPAITDQILYYLWIDGVEHTTPPAHEPLELIHTELKTPIELRQTLQSGTSLDGILCTALFLASQHPLLCKIF